MAVAMLPSKIPEARELPCEPTLIRSTPASSATSISPDFSSPSTSRVCSDE